jgi:hypothetical protein
MPIYKLGEAGLEPQPVAEFKALGLYERADLQRLLRDDISPLGDDLLVVAEEYGSWEDARRRIDLLAIDRTGCLVVIELKRTDDGGHMDLQAIRYAAMVSSLDFGDVATAYAAHRAKHHPNHEVDPRAELEAFLDQTDGDDEPTISSEVRVLLVSADFGREITTTVLWLNGFEGMDIRCVRLVPYQLDGKVFVDIQQVLPLPEAADYQVRLRRKDAARDRARATGKDFTRFQVAVDDVALPAENKRHSIRVMIQQLINRGVAPSAIAQVLTDRAMLAVPGHLTDEQEVTKALVAAYPSVSVSRYFTQYPLVDETRDATYVVKNHWGHRTESTLTALAEAFPESNVTFRRADPDS